MKCLFLLAFAITFTECEISLAKKTNDPAAGKTQAAASTKKIKRGIASNTCGGYSIFFCEDSISKYLRRSLYNFEGYNDYTCENGAFHVQIRARADDGLATMNLVVRPPSSDSVNADCEVSR